ncbi:MAG: hypothetical protein QXU99_02785 [Candidatus Bathyarchaeia archaeon]
MNKFLSIALLALFLTPVANMPLIEVLGAELPSTKNYERTFSFDVQCGPYYFRHKLLISVPPSLYNYYHGKSHSVYGDADYARFVTPNVFKSVAANIRNVTDNLPYSDEQFANAVLMLVRQVSYVKSDVKYPVETLLDNSGDCDLLSLLAASIMIAGGLDVVLLYYKNLSPSHMNIGVCLSYAPVYHTWWLPAGSFEYKNKTYWMAECTTLGNWRVGDQPDLLFDANPQIISLENCEAESPAYVAASLGSSLLTSTISITLAPGNVSTGDNWRVLRITGSISPPHGGQNVVLYVRQEGKSYTSFKTTSTDETGNYLFTWNFTSSGTYYVRTSVSGFLNYSSSDSDELTVFTGFYRLPVPNEANYYWALFSNDALARASAVPLFSFSANQKSKDFLISNLAGADVLLNGEFMVLKEPQHEVTSENKMLDSARGFAYLTELGERWRYDTLHISEQLFGKTDEFSTNSLFGFILQNNGENNFSAAVKVFNRSDAEELTAKLVKGNSALINASACTRENVWYKVTARVLAAEKTVKLFDANGTLLQDITVDDSGTRAGETGILVAYDSSAFVVFKNLKAETLSQTPSSNNNVSSADYGLGSEPVFVLPVLFATVIAIVIFVEERKRVGSGTF